VLVSRSSRHRLSTAVCPAAVREVGVRQHRIAISQSGRSGVVVAWYFQNLKRLAQALPSSRANHIVPRSPGPLYSHPTLAHSLLSSSSHNPLTPGPCLCYCYHCCWTALLQTSNPSNQAPAYCYCPPTDFLHYITTTTGVGTALRSRHSPLPLHQPTTTHSSVSLYTAINHCLQHT
jgi:hypothetical protein